MMIDRLPDLSILRRCWSEYADESTTHRVTVETGYYDKLTGECTASTGM